MTNPVLFEHSAGLHPSDWLTVQEAARLIASQSPTGTFSEQRVRKLITQRRIPARRVGKRQYQIKRRDVLAYNEHGRLTGPQGGKAPRKPIPVAANA